MTYCLCPECEVPSRAALRRDRQVHAALADVASHSYLPAARKAATMVLTKAAPAAARPGSDFRGVSDADLLLLLGRANAQDHWAQAEWGKLVDFSASRASSIIKMAQATAGKARPKVKSRKTRRALDPITEALVSGRTLDVAAYEAGRTVYKAARSGPVPDDDYGPMGAPEVVVTDADLDELAILQGYRSRPRSKPANARQTVAKAASSGQPTSAGERDFRAWANSLNDPVARARALASIGE